jgi:hypothetical protein
VPAERDLEEVAVMRGTEQHCLPAGSTFRNAISSKLSREASNFLRHQRGSLSPFRTAMKLKDKVCSR